MSSNHDPFTQLVYVDNVFKPEEPGHIAAALEKSDTYALRSLSRKQFITRMNVDIAVLESGTDNNRLPKQPVSRYAGI